ncbi:hypothetical protein [Halorussus salinus]|uniref:hypothetical protein n=1 Tax=Halorussus salinus TaxID=1364935 RepID=UPI001091C32A|nr:hypothetical protein [Halorussus salinus]
MTERDLYTLTIPADSQTSTGTKARRNTSKRGLLGGDTGTVESLSTAPDQRTLRGQFRGRDAEPMAAELAELFEASEFEAVAYSAAESAPTASTPADGYYTPETLDVRRLDPRAEGVVAFDGAMTRVGTRDSHRRAVETAVAQVENDFGNEQTAHVGIPSAATDVRWFDPETTATEPPDDEFVETRAGEHGSVDVYDLHASSLSLDDPTLVYDLPYVEEGKTDPTVWDDRGANSKFDEEGLLQWQRAFVTDHGFVGNPVLDNGLVRVRLDEKAGLSVVEWEDEDALWATVEVGTSEWSLSTATVTRIGPARVEAQCRFTKSGHARSPFALDVRLPRGFERPQLLVAESEEPPTPSGLQTLLKATANQQDYSSQVEQGLVGCGEVAN